MSLWHADIARPSPKQMHCWAVGRHAWRILKFFPRIMTVAGVCVVVSAFCVLPTPVQPWPLPWMALLTFPVLCMLSWALLHEMAQWGSAPLDEAGVALKPIQWMEVEALLSAHPEWSQEVACWAWLNGHTLHARHLWELRRRFGFTDKHVYLESIWFGDCGTTIAHVSGLDTALYPKSLDEINCASLKQAMQALSMDQFTPHALSHSLPPHRL